MDVVKDGASGITRRERAHRSRLRILAAARDVFTAKGYHGATMSEIAERSGLAVQTVSYFFGTKARLLSDLLGAVVMGQLDGPEDEGAAPDPSAHPRGGDPAASDWFSRALTDDDGHRAVASVVGGAVGVFARASGVADVARVAALTDPDVAAVYHQAEDRRIAEFGRIPRALADHGWLRPDLTVERATDILVTVVSDRTYLALSQERGWGDEEITEWFTEAVTRLLLRSPS